MADRQPVNQSTEQPSNARRAAALALLIVCPALTISVYGGMYLDIAALWAIGKPWIFFVPLLWHLLIDREKISWSPVRRGGLGVALAFGVLSMVAMYGMWFLVARHYVSPELIREKTAPLGLDSKTIFILGSVYWITINSLLEEYSFRWFIFRKFEIAFGGNRLPSPREGQGEGTPERASVDADPHAPQPLTGPGVAAIVATSFIFVVHHALAMALFFDWWINLVCCIGIFVGSAVWSWLYLRYRSIWPCYLAHACADVPIFTLGYYLLFVASPT